MINFEKVEQIIKNYIENYDKNNGLIKLKTIHTYEVVKKSEYIATKIGLDSENIELAKLIGLLHDIGRFEQIKRMQNFEDKIEFDHANYGVKILFEDGLIREFIKEDKYDNIIKKAVYNHNKYQIEEGLSDIELLHSKIIRDADKMDIFRVMKEDKLENIMPGRYNEKTINYEKISSKVYNDFMAEKLVKLEARKTQIDDWICLIAFIFDFNFDVSLQYIKEKKYIDILIDRIEYKDNDTKQKMEEIRKKAKEFLNK